MPIYRTRKSFGIARNVSCFVNLDVGVTRGRVPGFNTQTGTQVQRLQQQLKRLSAELSETREQLSKKDQRISRLEKSLNKQGSVTYDGVVLPPVNLRPTRRGKFGTDELYLESTRREVEWMVENLGLSPKSNVLDMGCATGRIATGILDRVGEIRKYSGVDIQERFLRWPRSYITPEHPNFQFIRLDLKNAWYNPEGKEIGDNLYLPFGDDEFDIICLFSVFTHMLTDDVRNYLKEFHRILHPEGKILMTANLEDGVPDVTENPIGYRGKYEYNTPLATVRYNREFFESLIDQSGFRLEGYYSIVREGQRNLVVSKA